MLCGKCRKSPKLRKRKPYHKLTVTEIEQINAAREHTGFSQAEVLEIYNDYNSMLDPDNEQLGVSRANFVEKTKILNHDASEQLALKIFSAIEKADPDFLSFREFLQYLHLLYHGTTDMKLDFSFKIIKGNNRRDYLTKNDFREVLLILLEIHSYLSGDERPSETYVSQIVDYIIEQFDDDKNDRIEQHEFRATSEKNVDLFGVFQLVGGEALKSKFLKKSHDNEIGEILRLVNKIKTEYTGYYYKAHYLDVNRVLISGDGPAPDSVFQSQMM